MLLFKATIRRSYFCWVICEHLSLFLFLLSRQTIAPCKQLYCPNENAERDKTQFIASFDCIWCWSRLEIRPLGSMSLFIVRLLSRRVQAFLWFVILFSSVVSCLCLMCLSTHSAPSIFTVQFCVETFSKLEGENRNISLRSVRLNSWDYLTKQHGGINKRRWGQRDVYYITQNYNKTSC